MTETESYTINPFEKEDKYVILDQILKIIFKNSPNKNRNKEMIRLYYYNEETVVSLALKFNIKERRVREIINEFKELRRSGYAHALSDQERRKIIDLIKEYKL